MKRFQPSAETEIKERHFRGLLSINVRASKGIRDKWGRPTDPPYLYIDLHGGPGNLEYKGHKFLGSPLIALEVLAASGLPYQTAHFEHHPEVAAELAEAIGNRSEATVYAEPFEGGLSSRLAAAPVHRYRNGLAYSDPIEDPIPVDTFNLIAAKFPRVDLLAYVAANSQYKRANGAGVGHGRRLADDVAAINKDVILVREPRGAHQWTFILWTNLELRDWKAQGFHRLDTEPGRRLLKRMDCTARELDERFNEPLPFRFDTAVQDIPRVPEASEVPGHPGAGFQASSGHV